MKVAGTCLKCSASFLKRKGTEFCTKRCYIQWHDGLRRPRRFCSACQKELRKGSHSLWCDEECEKDFHFQTRQVKNCLVCDVSLRGKPQNAKYCSREHYASVPKTDEMRKRVGIAGTGRKQSAETIAKRSVKLRGKKRTAETTAKIQAGREWYYKQGPTTETRLKMRLAKVGNPKNHGTEPSCLD